MKKIVLSAVVALVLIGCGDNNSTKQAAKSTAPQKAAVVEKVAVVTEQVAPKEEKVIAKEEKVTPKATTKPVVEAPKVAATVDAAKLFKVCSSCHGAKAEKKALGKSQVIAGWKSAKIVNALKGYKDGSYGGAMKAVMQGQAAKLNDADINALAKYISKF
jgi:cytochrome c553